MNLIAMTLGLLVLAFLAAAGHVLWTDGSGVGGGIAEREIATLLGAVPKAEARAALASRAGARGNRLEAAHGHWFGRRRDALRPLWTLVVLRSSVAWTALPIFLASFFTGVAVGLVRRERAKAEFAYSSVTWSYMGKLLFAGSVAGYVFTALSPIGLPIWALYVTAATGGVGSAFYFANLPPKF